jgi:CheY-like chemotaxis protein
VSGAVLVIDDDPESREALAVALEMEGYRVARAGHGREALNVIARDGIPRLVLLDLKMPVMDGHSFVAAVRRLPRMAGVPIVVIAADPLAPTAAHRLGAAGCLVKPVALSELLALVAGFSEPA